MASSAFGLGKRERRTYPSFALQHSPGMQMYQTSLTSGTVKDTAQGLTVNFVDADVSVAADTVTIAGHHYGSASGAGPVQLTTTGTLPGGLALTTSYYIVRVDANTIAFATTYANAIAGTKVNITSAAGGGTHTINIYSPNGVQQFQDAQVNVGTDAITLTGHWMGTGEGPVQLTTTGALPTGLALATDYWIIKVDANTVKLATSAANAYAGAAVDITAAAGDGVHTINARPTLLVLVAAPTGFTLVSTFNFSSRTGSSAATLTTAGALYLYQATGFTVADTGGTAAVLTGNECKTHSDDPATALTDLRCLNTVPLTAGTRTLPAQPFIRTVSPLVSSTANQSSNNGIGMVFPTIFGAPPIILAPGEGLVLKCDSKVQSASAISMLVYSFRIAWHEISSW